MQECTSVCQYVFVAKCAPALARQADWLLATIAKFQRNRRKGSKRYALIISMGTLSMNKPRSELVMVSHRRARGSYGQWRLEHHGYMFGTGMEEP